jgi:tetratricopeptide (TPR) repeat protein
MRKFSASGWLVFLSLAYALLSLYSPVYGQQAKLDQPEGSEYLRRGLLLSDTGRFHEAISELTSALEIKPNSVTALAHRSKAYLLTDQASKALEDINKAISLSTSNAALYKERANTFSVLGDYKNAVADYDRVISLAPQSASAYNNRAVALSKLNRTKEAVEGLNTAMEVSGASPDALPPSVFEGSKW